MKTHKKLLGLAVIGASLTMIGCGGSSSSSNSPSTPAPEVPPTPFAFNQNAEDALAEMKSIPEKAFPAELYDFLRTHLIEGDNKSGVSRFDGWVTQGDSDPAPTRNCGGSSTTFGTVKTGDGFLAPSTDNTYLLTDVTNDETGTTLEDGSSLYRSAVTVIFTDCEIVSPDDNTTVVATVNGPVLLERTWIGESGSRGADNRMDNFSFRFGYDDAVSITDLNAVDYELQGTFIDTHVYREISASAQQAISNLSSVSNNFVRSRLANNNFKGMYAFDAPNLSIITTPNGGTASQVQFNNFASVFVADLFGSNPSEDYKVSIESPYRGDENADASAIVFGSGEEAETLFIETLSNGGNDPYLSADFAFTGTFTGARLLRQRTSEAYLECPTNATIGYSSTPSAPLVAGISFLLDGNSGETTRVYVDENNTQTDRDPAAAISTNSHDAACRNDRNGPTRFIPLPGLGGVEYFFPA
ncbi:MAG: hypothetical protein IBX52_05910 [Bacterioplanes sp.]|nr:hypothetical protein [Bacterioplanes sp.]